MSTNANNPRKADKLVYLVTSDALSAGIFSQQISHFGYRVQVVQDLRSLENMLAEHVSVAVLVDIDALQNRSPEQDVFNTFNKWQKTSIPLMFLSNRDDQDIRLKCVRAGGIAFFGKPIDMVGLVDKLDSLDLEQTIDPYRVLIVEDQPTIANYYQMVLKMAGMNTMVATDSTQVLTLMEEFYPDLVLMDLYMPEINGAELAKVIRQIDDYVSIPIVFLSSEEEFSKQMEALSLGGDDFLTKPIKAGHLVAIVKSRLERLRILRSFMMRDSLTGLLNHTSIRGQLAQELNRCRRQGTNLALAMIDIDHFKSVNDNYGHAIGDSVLKSLSRLLKQRLRKSDIIGRYGGEEFVAILLDTDGDRASQVMNEIRQHFAEIQHYTPRNGIFSVTFSCGIASFPPFKEAATISDAADRALYNAKNAGRNRVFVAD